MSKFSLQLTIRHGHVEPPRFQEEGFLCSFHIREGTLEYGTLPEHAYELLPEEAEAIKAVVLQSMRRRIKDELDRTNAG